MVEKGMETQNHFEHTEFNQRNPKTQAEFRRESFWQIILPMILGILLVLAAVAAIIFSAVQPVSEVGRWASVSLIWIILPSLVFALLILALVAGLVILISLFIHRLPSWTLKILMYFEIGKSKVRQISDAIVEPIIKINSAAAALGFIRRGGKQVIKKLE